jgi:hypothetical protein
MTKLIVAFHNFAKSSEKSSKTLNLPPVCCWLLSSLNRFNILLTNKVYLSYPGWYNTARLLPQKLHLHAQQTLYSCITINSKVQHTNKCQREVMHKHISKTLIGTIRSVSENGTGNAGYDLRQFFLTWSTRSGDRFQGVPKLGWEELQFYFYWPLSEM